MRSKLAILGILAVPFLAVPATAQLAPGGQPLPPRMDALQEEGQTADALRGLDVYSADGQLIGQVVDVIVDPSGNAEAVHIDVGEPLGIGERKVQIGSELYVVAEDRIVLALTSAQTQALPPVE